MSALDVDASAGLPEIVKAAIEMHMGEGCGIGMDLATEIAREIQRRAAPRSPGAEAGQPSAGLDVEALRRMLRSARLMVSHWHGMALDFSEDPTTRDELEWHGKADLEQIDKALAGSPPPPSDATGIAVEALRAVHDFRGLCDANDLETWERIAAEFHRDTGYLRPGKDTARNYGAPADHEGKRSAAWKEWAQRKNDELDEQIRAALAALERG